MPRAVHVSVKEHPDRESLCLVGLSSVAVHDK